MGDIAGQDTTSPTVGKLDDELQDRSCSSDASTPDHDLEEIEQDQDLEDKSGAQEQPQQQQQKRKGGRKPIYATSEERKQRNRQAQAAFRERRTEYIKQLENTIKIHEETLQSLQQSHRSAADECLMLRYKNSLLERILLEKGIDVQAELQAKTGSPNLAPVRGPVATTPLAQPIQRYAVNKLQQNRRSLSALPKPDTIATAHPQHILPQQSPRAGPIAASHLSSPALSATKSPNFMPQGGTLSPSFGPVSQQNPQLRPQQPLRPSFNGVQRPTLAASTSTGSVNGSIKSMSAGSNSSGPTGGGQAVNTGAGAQQQQYYPSPFQNHYDQLDQEYDAQADYDDHDTQPAHPAIAPAQPAGFVQVPQQPPSQQNPFGSHMMPPRIAGCPPTAIVGPGGGGMQAPPLQPQQEGQQGIAQGFAGNNMFDGTYDPMLDADPFGLSASMHFPTQFSFDAPR